MKEYLRLTRTATYGFLAAIPLIIGYEIFMLLGRSRTRVAADMWIKRLLGSIGIYGNLALGLVILLVGTVIVLAEKKKEIELKPGYFGGMVGESLLWAPIFAITVAFLTVKAVPSLVVVPLTGALASENIFTKIGLSLGAGVYEEVVFRVILVSGLAAIGRSAFPKHKTRVYVVVAVVAAFIFSLVHYLGDMGDNFTFTSFTFRMIGGLLLNALYITRGFGIAAWTHAWYDIMVLLHSG
jgi:hypothetical protein